MIKQNTGIERVRSFLTGLRQYICRDCEKKFRAPDRRRVPREGSLHPGVTKHLV
jgi:uncharacterized protein YlaI